MSVGTAQPRTRASAKQRQADYPGHTSLHSVLYSREEAARQLSIGVCQMDCLIAAGKCETRWIGNTITTNRKFGSIKGIAMSLPKRTRVDSWMIREGD